jgi:DNA replication and repair protein RecF
MNNLELTNFRVHQDYNFSFENNVVMIIGPNGSGKTSILEALYLLSTTKSFRTNENIDMINENSDYCKIHFEFNDDLYEIVITKDEKKLFYNNNEIKKFSDYYGMFLVVIFSKDDIAYIDGYPGDKRRFFDMLFSQIDNEYLKTLIKYKEVIKHKNILLKENQPNINLIKSLNDIIIDLSNFISEKREHYIARLNMELNKKYKVIYRQSYTNSDDLKDLLHKNISKELKSQTSMYGVHKDNYEFLKDGKDASVYTSAGEARLMMIEIKIAFLSLIKKITNKITILLLDDILSELDITNTNYILSRIPKTDYVFITTPKMIKIPKGYKKIILKQKNKEMNNGKI